MIVDLKANERRWNEVSLFVARLDEKLNHADKQIEIINKGKGGIMILISQLSPDIMNTFQELLDMVFKNMKARKLKNRVIHFLKEVGETAFDATDDVGREKTKVWMNAATNCNKLIGKNGYVIAIHLNSNYGEPATGTEVFDWKGTQKQNVRQWRPDWQKTFLGK